MIGAREVIGVLQLSVMAFRLPVLILCGSTLLVRPDISNNNPSPMSLIYTSRFLLICLGPTARVSPNLLNASMSPITHPAVSHSSESLSSEFRSVCPISQMCSCLVYSNLVEPEYFHTLALQANSEEHIHAFLPCPRCLFLSRLCGFNSPDPSDFSKS